MVRLLHVGLTSWVVVTLGAACGAVKQTESTRADTPAAQTPVADANIGWPVAMSEQPGGCGHRRRYANSVRDVILNDSPDRRVQQATAMSPSGRWLVGEVLNYTTDTDALFPTRISLFQSHFDDGVPNIWRHMATTYMSNLVNTDLHHDVDVDPVATTYLFSADDAWTISTLAGLSCPLPTTQTAQQTYRIKKFEELMGCSRIMPPFRSALSAAFDTTGQQALSLSPSRQYEGGPGGIVSFWSAKDGGTAGATLDLPPPLNQVFAGPSAAAVLSSGPSSYHLAAASEGSDTIWTWTLAADANAPDPALDANAWASQLSSTDVSALTEQKKIRSLALNPAQPRHLAVATASKVFLVEQGMGGSSAIPLAKPLLIDDAVGDPIKVQYSADGLFINVWLSAPTNLKDSQPFGSAKHLVVDAVSGRPLLRVDAEAVGSNPIDPHRMLWTKAGANLLAGWKLTD